MPITAHQRHALLLADRTRDVALITATIESLLEENETLSLAEIETALRDAAAHSYVVVGDPFTVVLGMPERRDALHQARLTPEANRALLAIG
jgi:hypothetical protein